jgi:hypothetical protein
MSTFMEFLCRKYLGPPTHHAAGRDRPGWQCPNCDDRNGFSILPEKAGMRDRCFCHDCGWNPDEADLLKLVFQGERWPERKVRLLAELEEFESLVPVPSPGDEVAGPLMMGATAAGTPTEVGSDGGSLSSLAESRTIKPTDLHLAWSKLLDEERELLVKAHCIATAVGMPLDQLGEYCRRQEWYLRDLARQQRLWQETLDAERRQHEERLAIIRAITPRTRRRDQERAQRGGRQT